MNFIEKIKEIVISVVPMMVLVLILHFTVVPLPGGTLASFFFGGILLIVGLSLFLTGADIGMIPVGQRIGSAITQRGKISLVLSVGFIVGFVITIAEPDVQVLASQVSGVDPAVPSKPLVFMIAGGVGLFVLFGLTRILFQISYKMTLIASYIIVFSIAALVPQKFVGIAFDAGGSTTGPMTVPFIIALGIGVASVRKNHASAKVQNDSFGLVGVASVGPIIAVLLMGMVVSSNLHPTTSIPDTTEIVEHSHSSSNQNEIAHVPGLFAELLPEIAKKVTMALIPLVVVIAIFQIFLLKMPSRQIRKVTIGTVYTFIGLVIFLLGVEGGFIPAGRLVGEKIATFAGGKLLIPLGLIFGALVVSAEPAVWVLTKEVEEISAGHIRRPLLLISLSAGVALAVALAMLRIRFGFSLWYYLLPSYALALILTLFCPPFFTAIAFDSGGVASGPMSSTFIMSFALGASSALGGNVILDAFGVVAMIAMIPLIAIQFLGVVYRIVQKKAEKNHKKDGKYA